MRKLELCCVYFIILTLYSAISEEWTHNTVLDGDGRFHLYWTPPKSKHGDSEIVFKVEVQALGYVGLGLSPNGGMEGSDIVTGWIKDGKTYFQDRHALCNELPRLDSKQDWFLIEGNENGTHTMLKFKRKLDTCDKEDMIIDDSTFRVIYAYSEKDPEGEDPFYHYKKRGVKSMMLLQSKVERRKLDDPSALIWDIRPSNFTIPEKETTYWCKIYKSPELSKKHHIVYVEPLIKEGNEEFVHHLLLYECVGAKPEDYDQHLDLDGHECYRPNMPEAMKKCEGVAIAWAVGGENLVFPENVGLPLTTAPGKYFMLETHYDNQDKQEGITDMSGFRIHYTPNLRKYDAGTLMIGSTISIRAFIPPKQEEYTLVGHSNPHCLDPVMPNDGIKALGVLLHSHLIGKRVKARHFRENKELAPLAVESNYDFNYQDYRYFNKEIDILPGDQITVECTYNSSKRDKPTFGGESTSEEMCLAFILYYPHIDRYASLSVPTFPAINQVINGNFTIKDIGNNELRNALYNFDWETVDMKAVERLMMTSKHNTHCYLGNGEKDSVTSLISYPEEFEPYSYDGKSVCDQRRDVNESISNGKSISTGSATTVSFCNLYKLCHVILILFINFFLRN